MKKFLLAGLILLATGGVAQADVIDNAVANTHRSENDVKRDIYRKPAAILRFFGIAPGMAVFDVFAGGGYYSELISYVVGDEGSVTMYNNKPWDAYVGRQVESRLFEDRLPNVFRYIEKPEALGGHKKKYDAAIFVLGMHDIYYADPATGWPAIDKQKFLVGIYDLLKDGGTLGVIDHNAIAGSNAEETGKTIHRIDAAVVIKDLEAIGFTLEESSKMLVNPFDPMTTGATTAAERGKTSRMVLKFKK